jgi:hypothetical protein
MKRIIYIFLLACICISSLSARSSTARGFFGGAGTGALIGGLAGGGRGAGWGASKDADRRRYYKYEDNNYDEYDDGSEQESNDPSTSSSNGYRNRLIQSRSARTY